MKALLSIRKCVAPRPADFPPHYAHIVFLGLFSSDGGGLPGIKHVKGKVFLILLGFLCFILLLFFSCFTVEETSATGS